MSLYLNNKISFIQNSIKYPFVWIAKKLQYISNILKVGFNASKHFIEDNNHEQNLVALTPKLLDRETTSFFDKELYAALSEKNGSRIRNIAVSGGYSVGKSSHLLSFQHNHPNFEYAQISLAKFLDVTVEPKNNSSEKTPLETQSLSEEEKTKLLSERIEEGITQQLLYSAKTKQLPNSRLQRIREHSKTKLTFGAFCILIFVGAWTKIFKAEYINTALTRLKFLNDSTPDNSLDINYILDFISYSVLVLGGAVIAFILYRLFLNSGLSRISIKSGKVEFQNHGSVLHQHLDEIIYYFEKTKVNVVIFEDMDRFDKVEIFSTLREINGLLNNASQIGQPIYFIYAVKDNLFDQKERVKFFDLLLPILPVVNSNNAKELLIERLTKIGYCITRTCGNKHTDIEQTLVHTSAFYMDDMRLITNFVNELVIYKERLFSKTNGLDINKLYAIVLIKNLYPTEYSQLLERTGKVFNIFNKVNTAKKGYIKKLEDELSCIKADFDECERLTEQSHIENNVVFKYLFTTVEDGAEYLILQNKIRIDFNDVITEKAIFTDDSKIITFNKNSERRYYEESLSPTIETTEIKNTKGHSYLESRKYIDLLNENKAQELKDKQKQLEEEIKSINQLPLNELLKIVSICEETLNELNGEFGALEFLLKQGFFSNDYYDYISYFYEGTLTQKDKSSLLSLREGKSLEVTQNIEKLESFVFELTEVDTTSGKLINLDLMGYLLNNDHDLLPSILKDCSQYVDKLFEVVVLIEENTSINRLVTFLNKYNSPVLSILLMKASESHNEEHVITLLAALINKLPLNDFNKLVKGNENIIDIINSIENFGELYKKTYESKSNEVSETSKAFWEGTFPIKIKKISVDESFDYVLDTNMYEVNKDNYVTILSVQLGIEIGSDYQSDFLSYKDILTTGHSVLIEQVNEKLEKFVEIATLENFNEDEESTITLLNKLDLNASNLEKVIQGSPIKISDLNKIVRFEVQRLLINHSKVKNKILNLLTFFIMRDSEIESGKLDKEKNFQAIQSELISFINRNCIDLSDDIDLDEQVLNSFIKEIILNPNLNIVEFNKFVSTCSFNSQLIIDCKLNPEQWNAFIENICDEYEASIFTQIPRKFIDANIFYLEKFWGELNLEDIFDEWPLTNEIILKLLDSNKITDEQKLEVLTSENAVIEFLKSDEDVDKVIFDKSALLLVKLGEHEILNTLSTDFPMDKLLSICTNKTHKATIISAIIISGENRYTEVIAYISLINDTPLSNLFVSLNGKKNIERNIERDTIIKALIKAELIGEHKFNEKNIKFNFKPSKFIN